MLTTDAILSIWDFAKKKRVMTESVRHLGEINNHVFIRNQRPSDNACLQSCLTDGHFKGHNIIIYDCFFLTKVGTRFVKTEIVRKQSNRTCFKNII